MSNALRSWIAEQISRNGPVPFARFMEWALYHPQHGYYSGGRVRVGEDNGDFTTAPHVSGLFAGCLARFAAAVDGALGSPEPFVLIEGGPGEGRLARDLLDSLARREPDLYRRMRYRLDEISPALRQRQRKMLAPHGEKIDWGLPQHAVEGLYLSNELLDAMPVHRLLRMGDEVFEIWVGNEGEGLLETLRPPLDPEVAREGRELLTGEGFQVEVRPGVGPWLSSTSGCLRRGVVLSIDYGDEATRLFGPWRPNGTCVGYSAHRQTADLLAAPGEQDLTAQVDFTAVRRAGEALGLHSAPLLKQREFLFATGLLQELEEAEQSDRSEVEKIELRQAVAPLLMPGSGMGEAFKVLVQTKGLDPAGLPLSPAQGLQPPPR